MEKKTDTDLGIEKQINDWEYCQGWAEDDMHQEKYKGESYY